MKKNKENVEELTPCEEEFVKTKKYGFGLLDSSFAIILGAIVLPIIVSILVSGVISLCTGETSSEYQSNPIAYAILSISAPLAYMIFLLVIIKRRKKEQQRSQFESYSFSNFIKLKRPKTALVLMCVAIGVISLIMVNAFVSTATAGLQSMGYSKSNDFPFKIDNFGVLLLSLIFFCAIPAIAEEFIFRGIILGGLLNNTKNSKQIFLAILFSALIFALCHQSAQQFVYPLIMGVVFGLIYVITGNLWYNVIIHFTSNALVILISFFYNLTGINLYGNVDVVYGVISIFLLIAFGFLMFFVLKFLRKKMKNQSVLDVDNCDINKDKIQDDLAENLQDLKYKDEYGIVNYKYPKEKKDKFAYIFLFIDICLLIFILIVDLVTYLR